VYISPDRPAAVRALVQAHPDVDVIVSDDGLQHYALARDVEIAVVDAERRFGNALPLPAGPLREPISRLGSVDAVVVAGAMNATDAGIPGERHFAMRLGGESFVSVASGEELAVGEFVLRLRGQRIAAIAGIGHPDRFFDHLGDLGIAARRHPFADHYAYQPRELKLPGVDVILMTEKDAVKCRAFADARMWFLRVEAILPAAFDEFLLARLDSSRRSIDGPEAA
jgi:tetraacyldisaccharide 4'-kinase